MARCQWLTPTIVATQRSERSQFEASLVKQFVRPYLKKKKSQKRAGEVTQGIGPDFKPQYQKKKKKKAGIL
jgi:hypothetical protein